MAASIDENAYTSPFQLTKSMHRDVYAAVDPKRLTASAAGKVVLITGAAGGIGYAVAKAWSESGAKGIVLVGRTEKSLQGTAADLQVPNLVLSGDISNENDVQAIFSKAVAEFGSVDVVVNTAAYVGPGPIGETEPSQWWAVHEINVKGTYNLVYHLIKAGNGKGTFINLVSLAAAMVNPGMSAYGTSKLVAIRLGEYVDAEQPGIRFFSVHPGIVEAENGRGGVIDAFTPFAKDKQALTAGVTLYLQKPEADFLRGGFITVNWDVEEMEKHKDEIKDGNLLKLSFVGAKLGPEGHPWKE